MLERFGHFLETRGGTMVFLGFQMNAYTVAAIAIALWGPANEKMYLILSGLLVAAANNASGSLYTIVKSGDRVQGDVTTTINSGNDTTK